MRGSLDLLERTSPTLLVLLAVVSINLGSALAIWLFDIYDVLGVLLLRMLFGALILSLAYRRELLPALRRAPTGILLLGVTIALQSGFFYLSIARIPLGIAVAIEFLGPLSLALATSRRWIDAGCVLLAAAGILLLTPDIGNTIDVTGVAYAVAAGIAWAAVILINRRLGKQLAGGVGIALAMTVCSLLLVPIAGLSAIQTLAAHPLTLLALIGVALFSAAIPYLFEYLALKSMPPKQFGVLVALEPVVAALVGTVALMQLMNFKTWLAVVLISLASIVTSVAAGAKKSRRADRQD